MSCIFCKIVSREIKADIVLESDSALAFRDISPQAPVHVLVVPKTHIDCVGALLEKDLPVMGQMFGFIRDVAQHLGLESYRLIMNNGSGAGQTVFHLHCHVLSGMTVGEKLL